MNDKHELVFWAQLAYAFAKSVEVDVECPPSARKTAGMLVARVPDFVVNTLPEDLQEAIGYVLAVELKQFLEEQD